jgi:hypothetical protein
MPAQHEANRQAHQGLDAFRKFFSAFYVTDRDGGSTFSQEAGQGCAFSGQTDDRRPLPSEVHQMAAT